MPSITKLVAVCAVLCAILLIESQASSRVTGHEQENSYTLTTNVNLYTVSLTNTSLHVNSTDKYLKPCTIDIDPAQDYTINRIQAKALTTGSKFIVWGVRKLSLWAVEVDQGGIETEYTVLLVNPWACSYKSVAVPKSTRDLKDEYDELLVVANADSFDVFVESQPGCSPCRFDVEGKKVELEHQVVFPDPKLAPHTLPRMSHIQPMHPLDREQGYFFARNFANDTAVIEHLDQYFKTSKQLYVDHPVHSVSIWPGKDALLSICYATQSRYSEVTVKNLEVHCQQLDSNFEPKLSIILPAPMKDSNQFVYGMLHLTHQIDPLGNIYIGLVESNAEVVEKIYKYVPRFLRFLSYDKTGKLLDSQYFDLADTNSSLDSHRYSGILRSLLLVGNKFCLLNEQNNSKTEVQLQEVVRCFDIQKYYTKPQ